METITIGVKDFITTSMAMSPEKAEPIFQLVKENILKNNKIVIDFKGVNIVITAFLNVAYGKLYGLKEINDLSIKENVTFINTTESINDIIQEVQTNSITFFKNQEEGRKKNNLLEDLIDGNS